MDSPHVITTAPTIGRRRQARLRVRLEARLISLDGIARGVMADLSRSGARIAGSGLSLRPGNEAVLQWCGREAFGMVVWAARGEFGLAFHEPLADLDLAEIRRLNDAQGDVSSQADARSAARAFVQGNIRL